MTKRILSAAIPVLVFLSFSSSAFAAPSLQTTIAESSVSGFAGQDSYVTARVANTGDTASSDTYVAFDFGSGFVRMDSLGSDCSGRVVFGQVRCTVGSVAPGEHSDVVLRFAAGDAVERTVYATSGSNEIIGNRAETDLFISPASTELALSVKPARQAVKRGKTFAVSVAVSNKTMARAKDSFVCLQYPPQLSVVGDAYGDVGNGQICWSNGSLFSTYTYKPVFRATASHKGRYGGSSFLSADNADTVHSAWHIKIK